MQQQRDRVPHVKDKVPLIVNHDGGRGVQQQRDRVPHDKVPYVTNDPTRRGQGVQQQRAAVPGDQIPNVAANGSPGGVSMQRAAVPRDGMPHVQAAGKGRGVNMQRVDVPGDRMPHIGSGKFGNRGQGVQQQRAAVPHDKVPYVTDDPTRRGQGVQQQRAAVPREGIPKIAARGTPGGVSAQRVDVDLPRDGMPRMPTKSDGQGVAAQRRTGPGAEGDGILDGSRLRPWFAAIAQRLARCIILNRSWESALTDSVLQQTPSSPKPSVGVFLDPPYRTTRADGGKRSTGLYQGDTAAASDDVAAATYAWALEHGDKYRVAYCMHEGDFLVPPGWTAETMGFSGHRDPGKKEKAVDQVIFSPACVPVPTDPQLRFGW